MYALLTRFRILRELSSRFKKKSFKKKTFPKEYMRAGVGEGTRTLDLQSHNLAP